MENYTKKDQHLVTADMLDKLPAPVQRYLDFTSVVGKEWIDTVHLKQSGDFRRGEDQPWMPVSANQYYTTDPPGFAWEARFKVAALPLLRTRDTYKDGHGRMFARLAGLFKFFDVTGEQLDQGSMLRYLNEMMWFPTAFLGDNVAWQEVDEQTAEVTFSDHGRSVSGRMHFDDEGRLRDFTAMRYYLEADGSFTLRSWSTPITDYGSFEGLNLPVRGEAVWHLPSGELPYARLEVTSIEYNRPIKSL